MKQENQYVQFEMFKPFDEQVKDMDIHQLLNELDIAQIKMFIVKQEIVKRSESK